ncbi:unnamed protein product [Urochloa humidicola]
MADNDKPLRKFSRAFQDLSKMVAPNCPPMTVEAFSHACSKLQDLIYLLGEDASFSFDEYAPKVEQIKSASRHASTLEELIDQEKVNNSVKAPDSNSRILLRLKRALEFVKVLFQEMMKVRGVEFPSAAVTAYMVVFAGYHDKLIQNIVIEAIYLLPDIASVLSMINEEEDDAMIEAKKYVDACPTIIDYINELFTSRELGTDW